MWLFWVVPLAVLAAVLWGVAGVGRMARYVTSDYAKGDADPPIDAYDPEKD